ncbi:DUF4834 family protein [Pontibacter qinzhouensis]|uniref:DUF4834 family protein n=1 Tax=Pontibacter qinzhouensis TaxID=2603253 RepID=A0A5C8J8X8_9BACT|nr:DUF4834 family protein [Pontibacter qinzhouensis]TXK33868.1 DUF4834 family protein [Pontibacter qinzhouensis]
MIKFIFVSILIVFFIRLVAPVVFRWLLQAFVKKQMRNGTFFYTNTQQQPPQNGHQNGQAKAEGNVKIDYIPENQNKKGFDGGQYVDYEEVK